jgi:hypothetical protein
MSELQYYLWFQIDGTAYKNILAYVSAFKVARQMSHRFFHIN